MKGSLASFTTHTFFFPLPSNDLRVKKYKETIFARQSFLVFSLLCCMFVVTLPGQSVTTSNSEHEHNHNLMWRYQALYTKSTIVIHLDLVHSQDSSLKFTLNPIHSIRSDFPSNLCFFFFSPPRHPLRFPIHLLDSRPTFQPSVFLRILHPELSSPKQTVSLICFCL